MALKTSPSMNLTQQLHKMAMMTSLLIMAAMFFWEIHTCQWSKKKKVSTKLIMLNV
jgi:hypothetical protein